MKTCSSCKETKDFFAFYKDSTKKEGVTSFCRPCQKTSRLNRYRANSKDEKLKFKNYYQQNKDKYKEYALKKYGLTKQDFEDLLVKQDYSCKICKVKEDTLDRGLFVDHCHTTGRVRGLLCRSCNTLLGMAKDNEETLKAAIEYLKENYG